MANSHLVPDTAVILAGGEGSRLRPVTDKVAKPLVPLGGVPVVEHLLKALSSQGVRTVWMAVGHLADQVESTIGPGDRFNLTIRYSREEEPLSTIGPLRLISDLPERFLVLNGDIVTDLDFRKLAEFHGQEKPSMTIVAVARTHRMDYGVIEPGPAGVAAFYEKPEHTFLVSAGIYLIEKQVLSLIPQSPFGFDQLVASMLARNWRIAVYTFGGYWRDIGRPDDYEKAIEEFEARNRQM